MTFFGQLEADIAQHSIPYRIDLVKNKAKEEKQDEKALSRALWLICALSKVGRVEQDMLLLR